MAVGKGAPPMIPTLLAVTSTALIVTSVYTYNDLVDREMDSFNVIKKNRPLAAGTVEVLVAKILIYVTGAAGLFISWFINLGAFAFTALWFTVFILYSYPGVRLKKMYMPGYLLVCFQRLGFPPLVTHSTSMKMPYTK
jgi:4-hydroxybenzoate polyprenyltransferase